MKDGLLISDILEFAACYQRDVEIVSRPVAGPIHRYTYSDALKRTKKLANALAAAGVKEGDRIGTLAWNTHRHYEVYYAVSGLGAITHTINPRLFPEQLDYIINHAEDKLIFIDITFLPLLDALKDRISSVEKIVVLCNDAELPESSLDLISYESFIEGHSEEYSWPKFSDETAAALCYTSGTTGNPKGVLYSHRSTVLHAYASCLPDALNLSARACVLPVVPMFHVSAWGTPYAATFSGATLVLPGAGMDGASLYELIDSEQVSILLGVPTVWLGLLAYLNGEDKRLDSVDTVVVGGSAAPLSMIQEFEEKHGAFLLHAWGMTEMSPLGTACSRTRAMDRMSLEERYVVQQKQGRPIFGVSMKICDDDGNELARDGKAFGRLLVKGPWIIDTYFKAEKTALDDGWFDTGDVATIDPDGYMQIVDRSKDVIKSGGEWISSIELENAAVGHPAVNEACVIGATHPKWDERPLLFLVLNEGASITPEEMNDFLTDKVAKWWLPDATLVVSELPHTATGKLLKMKLREEYQDYLIKNPA